MHISSASDNIYKNIYDNSLQKLTSICQDVKEREHLPYSVNFDMDSFCNDMSHISQQVSNECTKLSIMLGGEGITSSGELAALLSKYECAIVALIVKYFDLPECFGKTLHGFFKATVLEVINSSINIVTLFMNEEKETIESRYKVATGIVWQGCKSIQNCPRNNKVAVENKISVEHSLVSDAFSEITESLEEDCEDSESSIFEDAGPIERWNNEDKEFMAPVIELISIAGDCIKEILYILSNSQVTLSVEETLKLDDLCIDIMPISKTVDNLIMELYPPLLADRVNEIFQELAAQIRTCIKTVVQNGICTEDEKPILFAILANTELRMNKLKENISVHNN